MIHHIDFAVTDFARSRAFYVLALAPLGMTAVIDIKREDGRELTGFGLPPDPAFWIRKGQPTLTSTVSLPVVHAKESIRGRGRGIERSRCHDRLDFGCNTADAR